MTRDSIGWKRFFLVLLALVVMPGWMKPPPPKAYESVSDLDPTQVLPQISLLQGKTESPNRPPFVAADYLPYENSEVNATLSGRFLLRFKDGHQSPCTSVFAVPRTELTKWLILEWARRANVTGEFPGGIDNARERAPRLLWTYARGSLTYHGDCIADGSYSIDVPAGTYYVYGIVPDHIVGEIDHWQNTQYAGRLADGTTLLTTTPRTFDGRHPSDDFLFGSLPTAVERGHVASPMHSLVIGHYAD